MGVHPFLDPGLDIEDFPYPCDTLKFQNEAQTSFLSFSFIENEKKKTPWVNHRVIYHERYSPDFHYRGDLLRALYYF